MTTIKAIEYLHKTAMLMCSNSYMDRLKAEFLQCYLRSKLLEIEIDCPHRSYTKKEMYYLNKQLRVMASYSVILLKRIVAVQPKFTVSTAIQEMEDGSLC